VNASQIAVLAHIYLQDVDPVAVKILAAEMNSVRKRFHGKTPSSRSSPIKARKVRFIVLALSLSPCLLVSLSPCLPFSLSVF
jgi:hypothetical protein